MPSKILDTHIHLYPSASATPSSHGWLASVPQLAHRHGIQDYDSSTTDQTEYSSDQATPEGFIYVETDRFLPSQTPSLDASEIIGVRDKKQDVTILVRRKLETWAAEKLEELKFLKRMVEGRSHNFEDDGFTADDGVRLKGLVIWAPFQLPPPVFTLYLEIARETLGERAWVRVVGFRYLLQAITAEAKMRELVEGENWQQNILSLRSSRDGRGHVFDIGVDTRGGGVWQVEVAADMVHNIRELEKEDGGDRRVAFVLNHLCKPDLSVTSSDSKDRWRNAITRLTTDPGVYMKLSGLLNEFSGPAPTTLDDPAWERVREYVPFVFQNFGIERVMFGSDWPVCNLGGPEDQSWAIWARYLVPWMLGLSLEVSQREFEEVSDWLWWRAGAEAYGIEM